ncbi:MAG TPA: metal ABC transporter ATP-binding protein [Bacillota bacterium]|nr:metal ABC transporter ATP-binding protein [Bacillota bacterium]
MSSTTIELKDISFAYNHGPTLEHISLKINSGDYVGVIGPNGGGKTTLIKLLLGLLKPASGQILLWGTPLAQFKDWHKIGYVPQRVDSTDFKLPISVQEVVSFGLRRSDKAAVQHALDQAGIAELAGRPLRELSGGQQQKAFIAKALVADPAVLILDEPTVGVDVRSQDAFYQLVAKLNKEQGLTIIMVSHDIDVVVNEVSKLVCINEELVYHGRPKEFIEKDYLTKLYGKTRKLILHGH